MGHVIEIVASTVLILAITIVVLSFFGHIGSIADSLKRLAVVAEADAVAWNTSAAHDEDAK